MTKEKVENCKEEMAYDYDLQNELIITGSGCCMRKRWSSRNGSGRLRCGCKGVWKIVDNFLSAVS